MLGTADRDGRGIALFAAVFAFYLRLHLSLVKMALAVFSQVLNLGESGRRCGGLKVTLRGVDAIAANLLDS